MQDRISGKPGRVLITPENGAAPYYAVMTRADEPEQEGTPLNKANLLTDETAALFGLGADAAPNDALAWVGNHGAKIGFGSYVGTGTQGVDGPCQVTLDFVPKMFWVFTGSFDFGKRLLSADPTTTAHIDFACYIEGAVDAPYTKYNSSGSTYTDTTLTFEIVGTTISWYLTKTSSNNSSSYQLNKSGTEYHYLAIG